MNQSNFSVVILAAGQDTRMRSDTDKVLHPKIKPGPPPKPLTMAQLPAACKSVLAAPGNSKAAQQ